MPEDIKIFPRHPGRLVGAIADNKNNVSGFQRRKSTVGFYRAVQSHYNQTRLPNQPQLPDMNYSFWERGQRIQVGERQSLTLGFLQAVSHQLDPTNPYSHIPILISAYFYANAFAMLSLNTTDESALPQIFTFPTYTQADSEVSSRESRFSRQHHSGRPRNTDTNNQTIEKLAKIFAILRSEKSMSVAQVVEGMKQRGYKYIQNATLSGLETGKQVAPRRGLAFIETFIQALAIDDPQVRPLLIAVLSFNSFIANNNLQSLNENGRNQLLSVILSYSEFCRQYDEIIAKFGEDLPQPRS